MEKERLIKFAQLIVQKGVNLQKGQEVLIKCGVEYPEFVAMVCEECYKQGASRVRIQWSSMPIRKLNFKYMSLEELSKVTDIEIAENEWLKNCLPCRIWLDSDDPDGLAGTDSEKISKADMARYPIIKEYREAIENKNQWTIAGVPTVPWAKKVFPYLSDGEAVEALWKAILDCSRVDDDPIKAWDKHNENLAKRCDFINSYNFEYLEYKSENGTNFKVGLNEHAQFIGGGETTMNKGIYFNPNIPSEEVFTTPLKGVAEGTVIATKPLSYQGKLIDNFGFEFKDGKVVKIIADKNKDVLEHMIGMDEGAPYIGEVALIGYDSPINNTGILFYNTLFDENASCHIALGMGYTNTLKDYSKYTKDELTQMGCTDSMIHVDFMMGSKDMSVVGITKSGERVQIFKDGNWVI